MKVQQTLSSGLTIRQDFRDSVRFVMFETEYEEWRYATDGGTAFVVNFRGNVFGITCKHVLGTFNWRQIALTNRKFGSEVAGLSAIYYPSQPIGAARDSDVLDVAVIRFSEDVGSDFFEDTAYLLDDGTSCTSESGDKLLVCGSLKDQSFIEEKSISAQFALLEFDDIGASPNDVVLRGALAKFDPPTFSRLTGLSGSPVFNATKKRISGMAVRGGLQSGLATLRYIDISDISEMLLGIVNGTLRTQYAKSIVRPVASNPSEVTEGDAISTS